MNFNTLMEKLVYLCFRVYWRFVRASIVEKRKSIKSPRMLFGPTPIINNKYWARCMQEAGYDAKSVTGAVPAINSESDFDVLLYKLFPYDGNEQSWKRTLNDLKIFTYVVRNFDMVFVSFRFQFLTNTSFWRKEGWLYKYFGVKAMIIPYGNDFYQYSKVIDLSLKHNLFVNGFREVFNEEKINERVTYWKNITEFVIMATMTDAAPRWDMLPVSILAIDTKDWKQKTNYSDADGKNKVVRVAHTPNHRGFKGTEFIIKAVEDLKKEGLLIELILIENKPNQEVKRVLHEEADILLEQLIFTGYALSGIEGMVSGLPVICNLDSEFLATVFRRYSYLNECPIMSATPENVREILRVLVANPELRKELGEAGRAFVEKYHSYKAGQYWFEKIIDKVWYRKDVDTLSMYHPLKKDSYNNLYPIIRHPLVDNKLPESYNETTRKIRI